MAVSKIMFQPGVILHEVIVGAFRAKGTSFNQWCRDNDILVNTARLATYGQSGGDRGRAVLEKMISDAGEEVVSAAYASRMQTEAAKIAGTAA